MSVPYDDNKLPTPECDHDWENSVCSKCKEECRCVSGETDTFKAGECQVCGYECEHERDASEGYMCMLCEDDGADHFGSMIDFAMDAVGE